MLKTILFDNDGVLVDTESLYFEATRDVMRTIGFELTAEDFVEFFLRQGRGAWHLANVDANRIPTLRNERNRRYQERLALGIAPINGVTEAVGAKAQIAPSSSSAKTWISRDEVGREMLAGRRRPSIAEIWLTQLRPQLARDADGSLCALGVTVEQALND